MCCHLGRWLLPTLYITLLGVGASLTAPTARAQPLPTEQVELPATVDLPRLVDLASARLGVNIEYDSKLSGAVTLRLGDGVSDDELWDLVNRLLAARGFTTVRMGGDPVYSVVGVSAAAGVSRVVTLEEFEAARAEPRPGFAAVLVPARYRNPARLVEMIKPLLSGSGSRAEVIPDATGLLIADLLPRVDAALRVLETIETEGRDLTVASFPLAHMAAQECSALISQVSAKRVTLGGLQLPGEVIVGIDDSTLLVVAPADLQTRWAALIESLDVERDEVTRRYDPASFAPSEVAIAVEQALTGADAAGVRRFRVVADELTGSVVVTGSRAQHAEVGALLERLAEVPGRSRRPTRIIKLRNRDAEDVVGVVQQLIASGVFAEGSTPAAEAADPRPPSTVRPERVDGVEPRGSDLRLAVDPATNSIIVIGPVGEVDRLAALVEELDLRRPQVLLEVLIVSLSESDALDLGVEIEAAIDGPNDTVAKLGSLFGLSSTGAGSAGIEGNRGAGFTGIVLNPGDFSVVLRALKSLNNGRSLSMPKVLVASNEQASINSVLEQPYTTLNASDSVATTSFGGSSNAGTEVSVTPQIAEGDHLRLEYQVSLSAFVGEAADASAPPPRQQNSIDSVATIPDGYTIAVGGIELTTEGYAETGIPLLSDVPVLGEAFKNRSKSSSRSRFYVFIRPTILRDRDFEDLKYLSDVDVARVGIDDGWPVPEPRLIR